MGSLITLVLANLEVYWGKNQNFIDHRPLFQPSDLCDADYAYVDGHGERMIERKKAYQKFLGSVLSRLELLGSTLAAAREEYENLRAAFDRSSAPTFERMLTFIKRTTPAKVSPEYSDDYSFGEFFAGEVIPRIGLSKALAGIGQRRDLGEMMENLHPWSVLRMLATNPDNLRLPVTWRFADAVEGGWEQEDHFSPFVPQAGRFLLVAEGSSDAKILRKAFDLLRPEVSDFFYF